MADISRPRPDLLCWCLADFDRSDTCWQHLDRHLPDIHPGPRTIAGLARQSTKDLPRQPLQLQQSHNSYGDRESCCHRRGKRHSSNIRGVLLADVLQNSNSNGDGAWALRECFVGMVTTNLAPIIPLFRKWLSPWMGRLESTDGNTNQGTAGASSRTMKSRNRDPKSPGHKLMTAGRHHSSDSSEHIIEVNDVEMQSYNSPSERDGPSEQAVNRKPVGMSGSGNGTRSPTLIIQRNGEIQTSADSANETTYYRNRPV